MTDEDLSVKACGLLQHKPIGEYYNKNKADMYTLGFKDGYKEGLKAKINFTTISDCPIKRHWHKVADVDYPMEGKNYLVKLTDGTIDIFYIGIDGNLEPYLFMSELNFFKDVEKWCEIPEED